MGSANQEAGLNRQQQADKGGVPPLHCTTHSVQGFFHLALFLQPRPASPPFTHNASATPCKQQHATRADSGRGDQARPRL